MTLGEVERLLSAQLEINARLRSVLVLIASHAPYSGPNNTGTERYALGKVGQDAFAILGWSNPVKTKEMK